VYKIEGSESPVHTRKETCKRTLGSPGCPKEEIKWVDYERQSRITGGVVNFSDADNPPFQPTVKHRWIFTRWEYWWKDCYGKEIRSRFPCFGTNYNTKDGWGLDLPIVGGMQLRNGQRSQFYNLGPGWQLKYILHIDEEPFRRLEERCRKYIESHGTEAPAGSSESGGAPPSEMPAGPTPLDVKQHEAAASAAPQEQSPPKGGSEVRVLDQGRASLSSADPGAEGQLLPAPPADVRGIARSHNEPAGERASAPLPNVPENSASPDDAVRKGVDSIRRVLGM
jgi:hypothetical protein